MSKRSVGLGRRVSPERHRRLSLAVAVWGLAVGLAGLPASQYAIRISSFEEVSGEPGYFGIFWEEDPLVRMVVTAGSVGLFVTALLLLLLALRSAKPRLRTAMMVLAAVGSFAVVGALAYNLVELEKSKRQIERGT